MTVKNVAGFLDCTEFQVFRMAFRRHFDYHDDERIERAFRKYITERKLPLYVRCFLEYNCPLGE